MFRPQKHCLETENSQSNFAKRHVLICAALFEVFYSFMDDFKYTITAPDYHSDHEPFVPHNPLNRPEIRFFPCILTVIGFIATIIISTVMARFVFGDLENHRTYTLVFTLAASLVYVLIFLKKGVVWLVKAYQHYAPDKTRLKCVFEPSCSEYMLLAIEKYGVFRGVFKGIRRLFRCKPPGGVDYP